MALSSVITHLTVSSRNYAASTSSPEIGEPSVWYSALAHTHCRHPFSPARPLADVRRASPTMQLGPRRDVQIETTKPACAIRRKQQRFSIPRQRGLLLVERRIHGINSDRVRPEPAGLIAGGHIDVSGAAQPSRKKQLEPIVPDGYARLVELRCVEFGDESGRSEHERSEHVRHPDIEAATSVAPKKQLRKRSIIIVDVPGPCIGECAVDHQARIERLRPSLVVVSVRTPTHPDVTTI